MDNNDSGNSSNYNRKQKNEKYDSGKFELKTSGHTESVWYEEIP